MLGTAKRRPYRACYKHLEAEIKYTQPKLILAMGRVCVEFFDAESRPSDYYGKFMWNEKYQSFIFFTYSLGFGYIGQENKEKLKKSLGKFYEMVKRNKTLD